MEVKHRIFIYLRSQGAEATPPLGTVIGNLGVNTVNFCKEFNAFTSDLPKYFTLSVEILIYSNRTFSFSVKEPPLGSIINLLIQQKVVIKKGKEISENVISLKSLIEVALWKFPTLSLKESIPIILGKIKASNIKIWEKIE